MKLRLLFVASTLSFAGALVLGSMAGCTVSTNDGTADASPIPRVDSGTSGTVPDGGVEASTEEAGSDAGDCLASKERGPLCEADETPEPAAKCAKECDVASTAFTSDIALAISDCIDDQIGDAGATPELCEQAAKPCVALATEAACANDVEEYCNGIVAKCPDKGDGNVIPKAECVQYMRGSTVQGKQLLLDCLEAEKTDPQVCKICMDALKTVHSGD